ncbi:hypothetical protein GCM10022285_49690 [Streptomyces tunisiensis]|uniref:SGNH hydrolase-type esterase domain-containing protein n=1 Tax=Streptomyces tunisiensis TaxID=948699 RepID=A0ABP7Z166_9ACTN
MIPGSGAVRCSSAADRPRPGARFPAPLRGPEATQAYLNWTDTKQDNTHFSPTGAIAVTRLVARELPRTRVLAPHDVRRPAEEIPSSWITWPGAAA